MDRKTEYGKSIGKIQKVLDTLSEDINKVWCIHEIIDDSPIKTNTLYEGYNNDSLVELYKPRSHHSKSKTVLDNFISNDTITSIATRKTERDYNPEKPLSLKKLGTILKYGCGYRERLDGIYGIKQYPLKYSNAQGGINHLHSFVIVNNVEGLEKGAYSFSCEDDSLNLLQSGSMELKLKQLNPMNDFVYSASAYILLVSDLGLIAKKYKKRSYRFAHIDAGIMFEGIQIISNSLQLKSCILAGFDEAGFEDILDLYDTELIMGGITISE